MANSTIFQQYLQPVRSVADYGADMDKAEQNQLTLAAARQGAVDDKSYREAAMGAGSDQNALVKALMGRGLVKQAQAIQSAGLEQDVKRGTLAKDKAATANSEYELDQKKRNASAVAMANMQSPQEAMASLQAKIQSGEVPQEVGAQLLQSIPQDPTQFAAWQLSHLRKILTPKEQIDMVTAKPTEINTGQQKYFVDNNPNSPTFGKRVGGEGVQMMASPESVLTDARARSEGAANRGVTVRGQNMTDSRARDTIENGKGQIVQTDNGPVLVNTRTGAGKVVTDANGQPLPGMTKPLNDSQSKALGFGTRMQEANKVFDQLATEGTVTSVPGSRTPLIGGSITALSSDNKQMLDQAKRDFMTAVLRRESGAAISNGEYDNADKQYFPQVGDNPGVIAQKKRNRELAMNGVLAEVPQRQRDSITPKSSSTSTKSGATASNW